ncbi:glycosyltransferase family 2 protein [Mucilaginibacter sp. BT774]|uniref:glycosyltransferase family 2 protein n=1 Tax=Mucilaginibacter sp. BT774 TaxID=3062276 RepID=UPI0026762D88|nr:glycosyltransferase [Mucilaginibacter sp. BT774]MDO3627805.1 glycosyltransferase [Mucilaginibacter sp. BT774]
MKLSVILINHNSRNGLRLALTSLQKAARNIPHEIIVVDNGSTDNSVSMLTAEFPQVKLFINSVKESLSQVYNNALLETRGQYILLINPDTIISADSITKLNEFMDQHPLAGGTSVRMVDFKGDYLQHSKHTLTGAWAAFIKFVGLSSFFPKTYSYSKRKADWVDEFETKEIDVLNETCMMLRRSVLEKTGLFDERFALYGYNIDLSYRVRLQGFKNYYYSKTYFIQLPRKAVNKFSWNYFRHFYGAMIIFAAKYLFKLPVLNTKNIGELYPSSYEVE